MLQTFIHFARQALFINHRMMSPPMASEGVWKTFNPLFYVVDIRGNWWSSENPTSKVETTEELEQVALAQRKLMREVTNIATSMQANYIQVQTLLAARRLKNRGVKAPASPPGLQTDTATSPVLRGDGEELPEDDSKIDWGEGKHSVQTGAIAVDHESSDVGEIGRGRSSHNVWPRQRKTVRCCRRYRVR